MSVTKRMVRIPADPPAAGWAGPVLVRGWLRVRQPWRHPLQVLTLFRKWLRLKRDVDRAKGFRSFEYWQRLDVLLFGMHVGWSNVEDLAALQDCPSHRDIARWATASRLVCAMKLETLAFDDARIISLGGFVIRATDDDVPRDALFPPVG